MGKSKNEVNGNIRLVVVPSRMVPVRVKGVFEYWHEEGHIFIQWKNEEDAEDAKSILRIAVDREIEKRNKN